MYLLQGIYLIKRIYTLHVVLYMCVFTSSSKMKAFRINRNCDITNSSIYSTIYEKINEENNLN